MGHGTWSCYQGIVSFTWPDQISFLTVIEETSRLMLGVGGVKAWQDSGIVCKGSES